jgi:hypothetical protein
MRLKVPETGAGNSTVAFSDSSATMFSSLLTASPSALSHWPISISVMDSPTEGNFQFNCHVIIVNETRRFAIAL